jgi:H2-forming N5,N10-methylenetetrahydromethanopterin dehydrogenase-like enzyme
MLAKREGLWLLLPPEAASVEASMSDENNQNDDLTGASILTLLQRSASMAEGAGQYAVDIAKELSRQLVVSKARVAELEDRLAELEVAVQVYRDRSEQAEQWLKKISSEIQGRVAGKPQ